MEPNSALRIISKKNHRSQNLKTLSNPPKKIIFHYVYTYLLTYTNKLPSPDKNYLNKIRRREEIYNS